MLSLLFSKFAGYIAGVVAVIGGIAAVWLRGKYLGKKEEQAKETEIALQQSKKAGEISSDVHGMSQPDLDKQLRRDQRD